MINPRTICTYRTIRTYQFISFEFLNVLIEALGLTFFVFVVAVAVLALYFDSRIPHVDFLSMDKNHIWYQSVQIILRNDLEMTPNLNLFFTSLLAAATARKSNLKEVIMAGRPEWLIAAAEWKFLRRLNTTLR